MEGVIVAVLAMFGLYFIAQKLDEYLKNGPGEIDRPGYHPPDYWEPDPNSPDYIRADGIAVRMRTRTQGGTRPFWVIEVPVHTYGSVKDKGALPAYGSLRDAVRAADHYWPYSKE